MSPAAGAGTLQVIFMTTIKVIFHHSNYKIIGLLTAGFSLLLLAVLFGIVKANIIAGDHFAVQTSMTFIFFSPLLAIILTSIRLRFQNSSINTFGHWVKASFINFLIPTIILSIIGLLITKQKDILHQLFFERVYIILFVPLIGLTISVITTLIFKRNS